MALLARVVFHRFHAAFFFFFVLILFSTPFAVLPFVDDLQSSDFASLPLSGGDGDLFLHEPVALRDRFLPSLAFFLVGFLPFTMINGLWSQVALFRGTVPEVSRKNAFQVGWFSRSRVLGAAQGNAIGSFIGAACML